MDGNERLEKVLINNAIAELDASLDGQPNDQELDLALHELRGFYFGEQPIIEMKQRYGVRLNRAELDAELQRFQQGRTQRGEG